jgi:glycosyltransferase involved in cell wall biosynthesis
MPGRNTACTSRVEGLKWPRLAMACGVPVVVCDTDGLHEIVEHQVPACW